MYKTQRSFAMYSVATAQLSPTSRLSCISVYCTCTQRKVSPGFDSRAQRRVDSTLSNSNKEVAADMLLRHYPFNCVLPGSHVLRFRKNGKKTNRTHDWTAVTLLHMRINLYLWSVQFVFFCVQRCIP
jgi:hypothetical protein